MHKTVAEAVRFARDFLAMGPELAHVDTVIAPPFTALAALHGILAQRAVGLGAQTMSGFDDGAYTGEISPVMLREFDVTWVILGHSEQRAFCGETDRAVNQKVRAALHHGITPIVAVGETADERQAGRTQHRVVSQTRAAFEGIAPGDIARCVMAYEPLWAIGSGRSDTPEGADAVMATIRESTPGLELVRMLYGGSVKPDNVANFTAQPHIDGALVGSASLSPQIFAALIKNALAGALR